MPLLAEQKAIGAGLQEAINRVYWHDTETTNQEAELILKALAHAANVQLIWFKLGFVIKSGKGLTPGDVVLCTNMSQGVVIDRYTVWSPRLIKPITVKEGIVEYA